MATAVPSVASTDTLVAVRDGGLAASGPRPRCSPTGSWPTSRVHARVIPDPDTGAPLVLVRRRHDRPCRPAPADTAQMEIS
jgi:hypothetical protein